MQKQDRDILKLFQTEDNRKIEDKNNFQKSFSNLQWTFSKKFEN